MSAPLVVSPERSASRWLPRRRGPQPRSPSSAPDRRPASSTPRCGTECSHETLWCCHPTLSPVPVRTSRMIDPGLLYLAVIGALLLVVALGLGVRVLWDIVGDARDPSQATVRRTGAVYGRRGARSGAPRSGRRRRRRRRARRRVPSAGRTTTPRSPTVVGACRRSLPMSDRRRPPNRADASSVTSSYGQTTHY